MKRLGLEGAVRGKVVKTTMPDKALPCHLDRVNRQFNADRSNQLWVLDFKYVSSSQGWLHVACVVDGSVRRIVSWLVNSNMHTDFELNALEQASMCTAARVRRLDPSFGQRLALRFH